MGISANDFALLRYIQERHSIDLPKVAKHFNKTETTIRREIEIINLYTKDPIIQINKSVCKTNLSYTEFVDFIHNIEIGEYSSNWKERCKVLLTTIFFSGYVNASSLYQDWGLSLTTKKQDTAKLRTFLQPYGLNLVTIKKKGLTIEGDTFKLMLVLCQILYRLFELTPEDKMEERVANTVVEKQIYQITLEHIKPFISESQNKMQDFLNNYALSMTYPAKKFLFLFICIMKYHPLTEQIYYPLKCKPTNIYFCDNRYENYIYNIILNMLDFSPNLEFPYDEKLFQLTNEFVSAIESCITYHIYARDSIVDEFYRYFYKQITANFFHCVFKDKTVRNTKERYQISYEIFQKYSNFFEEEYDFVLEDEHLSTLTMLLQKHRTINRIINDQTRKIVIVTGVPYERVSFFITKLKEYVDVDLVGVLDINAIYRLTEMSYDYIFCFSERIYGILKQLRFPTLLVHFFLENEDIDKLLLFGFRKPRKRFLTSSFVEEIKNMDAKEMEQYLKQQYKDYFI